MITKNELKQKLLDTELDNHLEYDKYEHSKDKKTKNSTPFEVLFLYSE